MCECTETGRCTCGAHDTPCEHAPKADNGYPEKKFRLADFFISWWNIFLQQTTYCINITQLKAAIAIMVCRTELLGVDYYKCPCCGEIVEIRHNCHNRFCPTCSWQDTIEWVKHLKKNLLNIKHRHVVITLPHSLNELMRRNQTEFYNILMRVSSDVFKDWFKHKHNIKPGIVTILHTFGEMKNYHVHTHLLVSWGGIDLEDDTLKSIDNTYVDYHFLQKKFRCKFEDALLKLFRNEELKHNFKDEINFKKFLKSIHKTNWHLHLEPPMETVEAVIRYIARYTKRACLSEYKITNIEGEYITFQYKDYRSSKNKKEPVIKELKCHYNDFFPLLMQHVPLRYFRMVRYSGAYWNFNKIPKGYKTPETAIDPTQIELKPEEHPKYCRACTRAKEYVISLKDLRDGYYGKFDIDKHPYKLYNRFAKEIKEEEEEEQVQPTNGQLEIDWALFKDKAA